MKSEPTVLVIVLAGGEGKRLLPLTNDRAKPAVPFGGTYRLIDFALSNFANAGYLKIVVLTQYKSHSLDRHITQTWRFSTLLGNYVTPVPAQMRRGPYWFQGSADAIYQNLNLISDETPDIVCVFGADHIYRMDPAPDGRPAHRVRRRRDRGRDSRPEARGHRVRGDRGRRRRPDPRVPREGRRSPPTMPGNDQMCLASMGNYVFDTETLIDVVTPRDDTPTPTSAATSSPRSPTPACARVYDFSKNVVPGQDEREKGYWRDVGTIDSLLRRQHGPDRAGADLQPLQRAVAGVHVAQALPPAKVSRGRGGEPSYVDGSLLCQGSIVSGSHVERSIIGPGTFIDHDAHVTDSILFPGVTIGPGVRLHRCIVDKNVVVPEWTAYRSRPRRRPRTVHRQRRRRRRDREGP